MDFEEVMEKENVPLYTYSPSSDKKLMPKCDLCNEDRKRVLIDEKTDTTHLIDCDCKEIRYVFYPEKYFLEKIIFKNDNSSTFVYNDIKYKVCGFTTKDVKKTFNKKDINDKNWPIFYENEDDCQKYCDLKNNEK